MGACVRARASEHRVWACVPACVLPCARACVPAWGRARPCGRGPVEVGANFFCGIGTVPNFFYLKHATQLVKLFGLDGPDAHGAVTPG